MPVILKSFLSAHIAFMGSLSSAYQELIIFLFLSSHSHLYHDTASVRSASSVQFSHVQLFATPCTTARQASLSIINSLNLLKLMSIELVMPSNHLILCHPHLLLPSVFPSIRVFSSESALHIFSVIVILFVPSKPTSIFLKILRFWDSGECHGQRSLAGYSPWGPKSWT